MPKQSDSDRNALGDLRKRAETRLKSDVVQSVDDMSPDQARKLVHELRTHQIELELQNEELRRAQTDLALARDRYVHLYDFAPVGYFTLGKKGLITEANLTFTNMLGVERARAAGKRFSAFVDKDSQDVWYLCRQRATATGERQVCEIRMRRRGQQANVLWVSVECVLVASPANDAIVQLRCAVSDITGRKRAEEQTAREKDNLERILDAIPDLVFIVDKDGTIRYVNPAMHRGFGRPDGKKCHEYLHDNSARCSSCQMSEVQAGKTVRWEWQSTASGKYYEGTDAPIVNADGSISKLKIMRDVSERREWDRKLDDLARFPAENPSPVLRIAADGVLLHANRASGRVLEKWQTCVGKRVPAVWARPVANGPVTIRPRPATISP